MMEFFAETSWWIYLSLVGFLFFIFSPRQPRWVTLRQFYVLPAMLLAVSLFNLQYISISLTSLGVWGAGVLLGTLLGALQLKCLKIKANTLTKKIFIPATHRFFLFFLFLIAAFSYYLYRTHPEINYYQHYLSLLFVLYGISLGVSIGQLWYSRKCMRVGPYLTE